MGLWTILVWSKSLKKRMKPDEIAIIKALAQEKMLDAETKWNQVKDQFVELAEDSRSLRKVAKALTQIPGYELLDEDETEVHVDDFVVLLADLRQSTKHLMNNYAAAQKGATELKRVFIETSVLLPCLAQAIRFGNGKVTEYLGDGLLAIFRVPEGKGSKVVVEAHNSAEKCIEAVAMIINPMIKEEYNLPPLEVGIGIARAKGIVNWVGLPGFMVPKVFSQAVFNASKCACGNNEILLAESAEALWPTVKSGEKAVVFMKKRKGRENVDAYLVEYAS